MLEPEHELSERGFKQMEPFTCTYGSHVRVYESSSAESPHIWVNIDASPWHTEAKEGEGVAHLSLEQAALLRDQLNFLISNHYQHEA